MSFVRKVVEAIKISGPQEMARILYKYIPIWIIFVITSLTYLGMSIFNLHQEYVQIKDAVAHHHNIEELVGESSYGKKITSLTQITRNLESLKGSLVSSSQALESLTIELTGWAKILETDINVFKSSADLTPFGLVECDMGLKEGEMRLNNANPIINVLGQGSGIDPIKVAWHIESAYKDKDGNQPSIIIDRRIIEINHARKATIDGSARKHYIMATLSQKDYVRVAPDIHIDSQGCGLTLVYLKPAMIEDVNKLFRGHVDFATKLSKLSTEASVLVQEVARIGE